MLLQQAVVPAWHRYVAGFLTARRPWRLPLQLFASGFWGSECEAALRIQLPSSQTRLEKEVDLTAMLAEALYVLLASWPYTCDASLRLKVCLAVLEQAKPLDY